MSDKDFWKKQSKTFNEAAKYYDKYRPSYPLELINDLIEKAQLTNKSRILEIGAGSGKATELFVDKGLEMTCIEPGKDLVLEGKRKFKEKNVRYYNCRFEEWEEKLGYYDFVISAQAFHWIPQPIGYRKCSNSLKDNKKIGLFWNYYTSNEGQVDKELKQLIDQYPIMYIASRDNIKDRINNTVSEIQRSGYFKKPLVLKYPWTQKYNIEEYIGFIKTGNGYLSLGTKEREIVEGRVKEIIDKNGGTIVRPYTCICYLADKK
jgi:SAM-dependent methyltransferase